MRKILLIGVVAALLVAGLSSLVVSASSHREAPFISQDPAADTTDVYAWVDTTDPNKVNLVTNYYPFQEPSGGPNFYRFSDDVQYDIRIDNDGDAREDITYRFRFNTVVGSGDTFLYNTGKIEVSGSCAPPSLPSYTTNWNVRQFYSVTKVTGDHSSVLASRLPTPPVNIGPASTPGYAALAAVAVCDLGGGIKVFAGQRDDPFFVDLGSIFDLLTIRPFAATGAPGNNGGGVDGLGGFNVQTIALQVPISDLTAGNDDDDDDEDAAVVDPVVGIWATSSRRETRVLRSSGQQRHSGRFIQVSRLGMPLVNEVVIPLGEKDKFNASQPKDDAQFLSHVTDPELAVLFNALYSLGVPTSGRSDLVTVFLTGIPGVNQPAGVVPSEMLRLNTSISPCVPPACSRMGALAGPPDHPAGTLPDIAGFPNGRRLGDDVTDIALRAAACGYGDNLAAGFSLCNLSPNNLLGDGVDQNDVPFLTVFPYVGTPHQGFEHEHHLIPPVVAFGIGSGLLGAGLSLGGVSAIRHRRRAGA